MVELVLCHGDGVVRRVDQLVDLLVVPLDHLEQLAHVRTRIAHKFRHLEFFCKISIFSNMSVWLIML